MSDLQLAGPRMFAAGRIWEDDIIIVTEEDAVAQLTDAEIEAELEDLQEGMEDDAWHSRGMW